MILIEEITPTTESIRKLEDTAVNALAEAYLILSCATSDADSDEEIERIAGNPDIERASAYVSGLIRAYAIMTEVSNEEAIAFIQSKAQRMMENEGR